MTGFVLLALLASLLLGVTDFLGGTLARHLPLLTVLFFSQLTATVSVLPQIVMQPPGAEWQPALMWGVVGGVAVAVAVASLYRALAIGTMGVVAPIAALGVLVPVGAGLAAGDPIGGLLVVGLIVAVIGTVLASGPEVRNRGAGHGVKPVLLALLAALGFGVSNLTIALGSAHDVPVTLITNGGVALIVYSVALAVLRHRPRARGWLLVGALAIGLLGYAANLSFAVASQAGLLTVVAVCASLFPAVTALLGWWFHRERLKPVQIAGVVFVLAGVATIAATS
ncbi:EamA family transporter [Ruicaihuangia caeni]|uniref:EamA family transporter n=1 Tax=Ruicaihuangia caeni TaxID=3042517 RepID=UPI00338E58F7